VTLVAATIFPDNRKALDACRARNDSRVRSQGAAQESSLFQSVPWSMVRVATGYSHCDHTASLSDSCACERHA